MNLPLAALLFAFVLALSSALSRRLCCALGLIKPNFRQQKIPASVGLTFLLASSAGYALLLTTRDPLAGNAPIYLLVTAGFGLLGLADDLWGSRAVGGFRGHLGSLLRGRPTTGGLKLVGGGLLALAGAWFLDEGTPALLLDAALIALSANALNLLDLRPGRALFGFGVLVVPVLAAAAALGNWPPVLLLAPAALAALTEWRADARAEAMMGDTGSNLLGAAAGLAAADVLPVWARAALLALLAALNAGAERVSVSALIARTPWLAALDRRLGAR